MRIFPAASGHLRPDGDASPAESGRGTLAWRARRFVDVSARERRLFIEACACLALGRLAVLLLPCRWMTSWMGDKAKESSWELSPVDEAVVSATAAAILRASRYTPWQSICLPQALAAKAMLRRRGIPSTLYLGVSRTDHFTLTAHAWTRSGRVVITGGAAAMQYTAIASFADRP